MGRIHGHLGLTTGVIVHGLEDFQRQANYNCDITYGQNNEFGFDYLRDNMKKSPDRMVQRGLTTRSSTTVRASDPHRTERPRTIPSDLRTSDAGAAAPLEMMMRSRVAHRR